MDGGTELARLWTAASTVPGMRRSSRTTAGGLPVALARTLLAAALLAALAVGSGYVAGRVTLGQVRPSARSVHVQGAFDLRRAAYTTVQHQLAGFQLTEAQFEVDVELATPPTFDGFDVIGLEDSLSMELAAVVETASPQVGAAGEVLRVAALAQLRTMARVASARRAPGGRPRELTADDLQALMSGQRRLARAVDRFLTVAHEDLGAALT